MGGLAGKSAMVDAKKTTACPIGHMTYTQAPAACEKNIFHLFHFTQPVKNHSSAGYKQSGESRGKVLQVTLPPPHIPWNGAPPPNKNPASATEADFEKRNMMVIVILSSFWHSFTFWLQAKMCGKW